MNIHQITFASIRLFPFASLGAFVSDGPTPKDGQMVQHTEDYFWEPEVTLKKAFVTE